MKHRKSQVNHSLGKVAIALRISSVAALVATAAWHATDGTGPIYSLLAAGLVFYFVIIVVPLASELHEFTAVMAVSGAFAIIMSIDHCHLITGTLASLTQT
jgi:hypothetical protein